MRILYFNGPEHDYMAVMLAEGFNLMMRQGQLEVRCLNPVEHHLADTKDLPVFNEEACLLSLDWADIIVFDTAGMFQWMTPGVAGVFNNKVIRRQKMVLVDGTDTDSWVEDPNEFVCYFKREMRYPGWMFQPSPLVRSLSFGILDKLGPADPTQVQIDYGDEWDRRDIDISFVAQNTNGLRMQFAGLFATIAEQNPSLNIVCSVMTGKAPMSSDEYYQILRRSKLAFSAPGVGYDTMRYWEIPACGAVLMSYDVSYRLQIRDNYERNRHALFVESFQQALAEATNVLSNKVVWCMMRRAADLWSARHTSVYRAQQLIGMAVESGSFTSGIHRGIERTK